MQRVVLESGIGPGARRSVTSGQQIAYIEHRPWNFYAVVRVQPFQERAIILQDLRNWPYHRPKLHTEVDDVSDRLHIYQDKDKPLTDHRLAPPSYIPSLMG
jgi:hypothetical protein